MIVYNYTKVKRRDKKLYSLFNTTVSKSGLSLKMIYTCLAFLILFSIFGIIVCLITGTFWYSPLAFANSSMAGYFYIVFVFCPISIGVILNSAKIQNYKAIDYLRIYFRPKKPLNQDGGKIKLTEYKMNTFMERL